MVCRHSPPLVGCHSPRERCARSPTTCCQVAPPSSLLKSPAGSIPAYSVPCAWVTHHTWVTSGPSSAYVRPSLDWVQVWPRSRLCQMAGPYQLLAPPAYIVPPSNPTWNIDHVPLVT